MKKLILLPTLIIVLFSICFPQQNLEKIYTDTYEKSIDTVVFVPYRKGDKWFFIDRRTKGPYAGHAKAFEGEWDKAIPFNQYYLAAVTLNGKTGFIDTTGKVVIPVVYYKMTRNFKDGIASMDNEERISGVINLKGDTLFDFKYRSTSRPSDGLIILDCDKGESVGNNKGEILLKPGKYRNVNFIGLKGDCEYITFSVDSPPPGVEKWSAGFYMGYMDRKMNVIVPPKYHIVDDFWNGMGIVKYKRRCGYINRDGKEVIPLMYSTCYPFVDEFAVVEDTSWHYGIIDKEGETVIPFIYEELGISGFPHGWMPAKKNGFWGIINKKNKVLVDFKYDYCGSGTYINGLLTVEKNELWGMIDSTGKEIIPIKYGAGGISPKLISPNRIFVRDKETSLVGMINRKNEIIAPLKYSHIGGDEAFHFGLIKVSVGSGSRYDPKNIGYIDIWGKEYFEE